MIRENGAMEGEIGTRCRLRSAGKKSVPSNVHLNLARQETDPSLSDGCDSSTNKSADLLEFAEPKSNANVENPTEEANSKPGVGSRSQGKLQGEVPGHKQADILLVRTNAKLGVQKALRNKPELNGRGDVDPAKYAPQPMDM